jgi:glycosyltransferase involved in cell wall biosynthesis
MQPQGPFLRRSKQRLLKRAYDILVGGRIAAGASRFVAATQVEAESLRESGIECEKIAIVPNGIELRNAPALPQPGSFRRRINRPSGVPLIVSVGRVDEIKGFDLMLHAMAMVPLPATYVVVGPDHGFGAHLRRLACKLGLESRFVLTGALRDAEDVMAAIVDADVFVLPSRHEAFGQVILEACLASKPMVLSTGVNSAADFADRAALVVPPQPSALAGAVNRLLGDPALCARFGAEGRRMLDCDYRIEAVAAKLERVYESAISRN